MAQYSGFFNSTTGDKREYSAAEFAEYFHRFISNGIYSENGSLGLKVTTSGTNVIIGEGFAYIRGYIYKNDSPLTLSLSPSDGTLQRIDRVVLRFDEVAREIKAEIKEGNFSSSPTPPVLTDTGTIKELSLAQVLVRGSGLQVTDERLTEHCGQVSLLIDVPLNDLYNDWEQWKSDNQEDFHQWRVDEEISFTNWYEDLQLFFDEGTTGNLLALIDTKADKTTTDDLEDTKMDKSKIIISSSDAVASQMSEGDIWIKYI